MQPNPLIPEQKPKKVLVADPEFGAELKSFVDAIIEEEKKDFRPGLETFDVHASRIRQQVNDAMSDFQKNYTNGFETICAKLVAQGIEPPKLEVENLKIFDDPLVFMDALDQGKAIYQLMGFSDEQLKQFYEAAYKLVVESEFAKAKDSFYFLVVIATHIPAFWLGLGLSCAQMKEYEGARDAFQQAISLDPTNADAYLGSIHALLKLEAIDDACTVCDEGLSIASANTNEAWSLPLQTVLEEAKRYLNKKI